MSDPVLMTINWPEADQKFRVKLLKLLRASAFTDVTIGIVEPGKKKMRYLGAHR